MAKRTEYTEAERKYWQEGPEEGKKHYDLHRGPSDADPEEWEGNLQRFQSGSRPNRTPPGAGA